MNNGVGLYQVASAEEEIDWTHFTFQHGFRQLPQQLLQQLHHPVTSALPSAFPEVDVKMSEASQSPSPSPLGQFLGATQRSADLRSESDAASAPAATAPSLNIKDDPAQHARRDSPAELARHEEAEHGALKEEDVPEGEGEVGMAAEGEGLGGAGEEGSDGEVGAEGQRLTRSRRGNAAGLYMLDHGSQLIPKKASSPFATPCQPPC